MMDGNPFSMLGTYETWGQVKYTQASADRCFEFSVAHYVIDYYNFRSKGLRSTY